MALPGDRIQTIRKEQGLTQRDIAARCNPPMDFTAIGRIERGYGYTGESLRRIAEVLKCSVEDFFLPEALVFWRHLSSEERALLSILGHKLTGKKISNNVIPLFPD